jgi:hypothetical protein
MNDSLPTNAPKKAAAPGSGFFIALAAGRQHQQAACPKIL